MRRDLVLVRCGQRSRHPTWLSGATDRAFDLWTCPYEEVPPSGDEPDAAPWPGGKWTGLARRLALDGRWRAYDRIWLPDDDLDATGEDLGRFFELCRRHDAALAQPALAEGSSASHLVTLANRAFRARATTFVEVMAPCFRRDVLERLLPTLAASASGFGWGLDDAWARLLDYRGLFVFDEVTVGHFREVGAARSRAQRRTARGEMRRVRRRFDACSMRKTTAGLDASGDWISEADPTFLPRYEAGYAWYLASEPRARARLRRQQAMDPEAALAAGARDAGWRRALRAFAGGPRDRPPPSAPPRAGPRSPGAPGRPPGLYDSTSVQLDNRLVVSRLPASPEPRPCLDPRVSPPGSPPSSR